MGNSDYGLLYNWRGGKWTLEYKGLRVNDQKGKKETYVEHPEILPTCSLRVILFYLLEEEKGKFSWKDWFFISIITWYLQISFEVKYIALLYLKTMNIPRD